MWLLLVLAGWSHAAWLPSCLPSKVDGWQLQLTENNRNDPLKVPQKRGNHGGDPVLVLPSDSFVEEILVIELRHGDLP